MSWNNSIQSNNKGVWCFDSLFQAHFGISKSINRINRPLSTSINCCIPQTDLGTSMNKLPHLLLVYQPEIRREADVAYKASSSLSPHEYIKENVEPALTLEEAPVRGLCKTSVVCDCRDRGRLNTGVLLVGLTPCQMTVVR